MALNNRGGGPDLLSKFLQPNTNLDIQVAEDDDVSRLSFNDNKSYICDLAMQKKNRKAMIAQEAFEETQELYEVAIGEGAAKTQQLFKEIFVLVETELLESYKEKDKLLEQRLEAAVLAEKERIMASVESGPGQRQVDQIDKKIHKEETKILKKKIKKIRNMVKDIMNDKHAMKDEKKSKQLKRLQKKHDNLVDDLENLKKKDTAAEAMEQSSTSLDLGSVLGALGGGDDSDGESEQRLKKKKSKPKKSKSTDSIGKIPKPPRIGRAQSDKPKSSTKKKTRSGSKGPNPRSLSPKGLASIDERRSPKSKKKTMSRVNSKDSLKSSGTAETEKTTYTFKAFKKGRVDEEAVDMKKWEEYLSESEFEKAFKMSRSEFNDLPHFKQSALKRELQSW